MEITAQQVNELRKRTGVSMMACKKALVEANGNQEEAIDILRKNGEAKAASKADRETNEGVIVAKIEGDKAVILRLSCETDFVAKNEEFLALANGTAEKAIAEGVEVATTSAEEGIKALFTKLGENMSIEIKEVKGSGLGQYIHTNGKVGAIVNLSEKQDEKARDIAMQISAMDPLVISPDEVAEETVAREREIWKDQLAQEGKPADIIEKIMQGKERKFREESALMKQSFIKDGEKTVEQYLEGNVPTQFVRMAA